MAVLVSLAGLPGTGKSTVGKRLAQRTGAVFLRVDEIETVIRAAHPERDLGPEGYDIAAALAVSNLVLGHHAIVDCVNPWPLTRALFRAAAERAGARFLGVELVCSDAAVHRARVEGRPSDIPGHVLPDWEAVLARDYRPFPEADLRIDTAEVSAEDAAVRIAAAL